MCQKDQVFCGAGKKSYAILHFILELCNNKKKEKKKKL